MMLFQQRVLRSLPKAATPAGLGIWCLHDRRPPCLLVPCKAAGLWLPLFFLLLP